MKRIQGNVMVVYKTTETGEKYFYILVANHKTIIEGEFYVEIRGRKDQDISEMRQADFKLTNEWFLYPYANYCYKVIDSNDPKFVKKA
jgi:hypothetical protein